MPLYPCGCLERYRPKHSRCMLVRDICLYHTLHKSYSRSVPHVHLPKASIAVLLNLFVHLALINHLKSRTPPQTVQYPSQIPPFHLDPFAPY